MYSVRFLDPEVLEQCIKNTVKPVERAVLDWKEIRGLDKYNLLKLLNKLGLEFEKI